VRSPLLCCSPPGTGKTSTILAVARKINGPKYQSMVLELNASDDRGIDVVREQIKGRQQSMQSPAGSLTALWLTLSSLLLSPSDFASSRKLFSSGLKLVILDEADSMTRTAQFALRRVIEKYTKSTRFCIICNCQTRRRGCAREAQ
jgi:replication factor C subunit 3/5